MQHGRTVPTGAALSLVFTYLFFLEYLPPLKRFYVPYDLSGVNYSLADYTFQSLRQGRFPEWDPSIYCGLSFVGNVQAGLFYPPKWILWIGNLGRSRLSFKSLEILVMAHVWLAFLLCYLWLRDKYSMVPAVLGAGVFAYSGYMPLHLQHLGVVLGYAWTPLGFWGVDQAVEARHWRPLWKLVAASALCFLAGYPPTWFVFCVCVVAYAVAGRGRWRMAVWTGLALTFSLAVVMVQLLPLWEASALKIPESKYGHGYRQLEFYLSYTLPNYFDFELRPENVVRKPGEYLYLGAPAIFALTWLARRRRVPGQIPALAIASVSLVAISNPFDVVSTVVVRHRWLSEICRDWYFLEGLTLAAVPFTAAAIEDFSRRASRPLPRWLTAAAIAVLVAWSVRQVLVWLPDGAEFAAGWRSAYAPAIMLGAFTLGILVLRAERGLPRLCVTAVLLLAVGVDYKVFGTSRSFDAEQGDRDAFYASAPFPGLDDEVYATLRHSAPYRIAVDYGGPYTGELRHYGLATPQGLDPLLPVQYRQQVEAFARFGVEREFVIDPPEQQSLRLLGVRYIISTPSSPSYSVLSTDPSFQLLEPARSYYRVFELVRPQLPYRWDGESLESEPIECTRWEPERREFVVRSRQGGRLVLVEQFFPGWIAKVDGKPAKIERWQKAFQAVQIAPGEHRVEFQYRSAGLRLGAVISLLSVLGLWLAVRKSPSPVY